MRKKQVYKAVALAVLLGIPSMASAKGYVAGSFGIGQFDYDDINNGSAKKINGGYLGDTTPVYFELAHLDTGDADVEGFNGVTLNVKGLAISVGYRGVLNPSTGSAFWIQGGIYDTDTTAAGPGGSIKESNNGLQLGMGGDWMITPNFGLRMDLDLLVGVEDFADDKNVTLITFGPIFMFGGQTEKQ